MAAHFSSRCMTANVTRLASFAGFGNMHSRCTLNLIPSVLLLWFAWSVDQASTPSSPGSLLTIVDASALVYLANTLYNSMLASTHFLCLHQRTRPPSRSPRSSLTPSASAASNVSANSRFIPDTAVLIFHDQFYHWSSPPDNVPRLSNPLMFNCGCSNCFSIPATTVGTAPCGCGPAAADESALALVAAAASALVAVGLLHLLLLAQSLLDNARQLRRFHGFVTLSEQ